MKKLKEGISYAKFNNGKAKISKLELIKEKNSAKNLESKRARICFHQNDKDKIHEMIITFHKDSYIRPHKHISKSESYLVLEGEIEIIFFNDIGKIKKRVLLSDYNSNNSFYMKSINEEWHTILIKSDFAVILEITNGPFDNRDCVFAKWAPGIKEESKIKTFLEILHN